jgi:formylglycine-generating enzyme required for sulfatase activity
MRERYRKAALTGRSAGRPGGRSPRFSNDWLRDGSQDQAVTGVDLHLAREVATWLGLSLPSGYQWVASWQTFVAGGGRSTVPADGNRVNGLQNTTLEWTDEGFMVGVENGRPAFKPRPEGRTGRRPAPPVGVRFVRPE